MSVIFYALLLIIHGEFFIVCMLSLAYALNKA